VLLVQGDHRVAILAAQDIPAGRELTLDYRYDRARAPAWHNADL
jgi:SET domain-containing protein